MIEKFVHVVQIMAVSANIANVEDTTLPLSSPGAGRPIRFTWGKILEVVKLGSAACRFW